MFATDPDVPAETTAAAKSGARHWRFPGWLAWSLGVVALLGIAISVDFLSGAVRKAVNETDAGWWGAPLTSSWVPAQIRGTKDSPLAISLHIVLRGDQLSARYTLTAPRSPTLIREVLNYPISQDGDQFVAAYLGTVNISWRQYGVTGDRHYWLRLNFGQPVLRRVGPSTIALVSSSKLQVDADREFVQIDPPSDSAGNRVGTIVVSNPGGAVTGLSGASITQAPDPNEVLSIVPPAPVTTFAMDDAPAPDWMLGLRAVGQIVMPQAANDLLIRLVKLLYYLVLLWGLTALRNASGWRRPMVVIRDAVALIVAALAVFAALGFGLDLVPVISGQSRYLSYLVAAPLGLMTGAAFVLWPAAAWHLGRTDLPALGVTPSGRSGTGRFAATAIPASLAMGTAYLVVLHLAFKADLRPSMVALAALLCLLAAAIACLPPARKLGRLRWLIFPSLIISVLGSTLTWPLLGAYSYRLYGIRYVNVAGKWLYVLLAGAIVGGLCLIAARVVTAIVRQRRRQWIWMLILISVICLVTLPSAIKDAQLTHPHLAGLNPWNLLDGSDLPDALPQLLDWALVGLAAAALTQLPEMRSSRRAVRAVGIAMLAILLCEGGRWLYLPISLTLGYAALAVIALPSKLSLDQGEHGRMTPTQAVHRALAAWHRLQFVTSQQQSLISSSADALRDVLLQDGITQYNNSLVTVERAQQELGDRRDHWQQSGRHVTAAAFDHQGLSPSTRSAMVGMATGCIWAIVPTLIMILSSSPTGTRTDYPALDFLGGDAWTILRWPFVGWCIGYLLPFIRGDNGVKKGLWLYAAVLISILPTDAIYNDGADWIGTLIFALELFSFFIVCSVITCDLLVLTTAGRSLADWTKVHNWRFALTWSSAVLAALGTATAAFLSTAVTDIGQQAATTVTGQTTTTTQPVGGGAVNAGKG